MAHPLGRLHRNLHSAKSPAPAAGPAALGRGAERAGAPRPELRRVGYFGSYARGDWGPGSDLDVMIVVAASGEPMARRPLAWGLTGLPGRSGRRRCGCGRHDGGSHSRVACAPGPRRGRVRDLKPDWRPGETIEL